VSNDPLLSGEILFEITTPLGFSIRTTASYWELITTVKHPVMRDRLEAIRLGLTIPEPHAKTQGSRFAALAPTKSG